MVIPSLKRFFKESNQEFKKNLVTIFPNVPKRKIELAMKRIRKSKHDPSSIYDVLKWLNNGEDEGRFCKLSQYYNKCLFHYMITERVYKL